MLAQVHGSETDLGSDGSFQGVTTPMEGYEIITAKLRSGEITMKASVRPTDTVALFTDGHGNNYTGGWKIICKQIVFSFGIFRVLILHSVHISASSLVLLLT